MIRRAFTLVEVLVALVIMGFVTGMVMTVFQYQNRNWKTEADKAEVTMMARGTLDEITRTIRMSGGWLPDSMGGMKVYGSGNERLTIVINGKQWKDTVQGSTFIPSKNKFRIAVKDASKFSGDGFVCVSIKRPKVGAVAPDPAEKQEGPPLPPFRSFRILDRVVSSGGCGDSLVLDATQLTTGPTPYTWPEAIQAIAGSEVSNLDSVTYRKSGDTLYTKWNFQPEAVFALGVDSFRLWYWHPVDGWKDSLSGTKPSDRIEKVRIRLVMRTRKVDKKLLSQSPATRGYRFSKMETEVALRNDKLKHK